SGERQDPHPALLCRQPPLPPALLPPWQPPRSPERRDGDQVHLLPRRLPQPHRRADGVREGEALRIHRSALALSIPFEILYALVEVVVGTADEGVGLVESVVNIYLVLGIASVNEDSEPF